MKAECAVEGKPGAWEQLITKPREEYRSTMYRLHHPDTKVDCSSMKRPNPASIVLGLTILLSASCVSVPDANGIYNGKPVLTRASHPAGGSMREVKGTYLGRRYFTPPGSKSGLQWIDVYGQ